MVRMAFSEFIAPVWPPETPIRPTILPSNSSRPHQVEHAFQGPAEAPVVLRSAENDPMGLFDFFTQAKDVRRIFVFFDFADEYELVIPQLDQTRVGSEFRRSPESHVQSHLGGVLFTQTAADCGDMDRWQRIALGPLSGNVRHRAIPCPGD